MERMNDMENKAKISVFAPAKWEPALRFSLR